MKTWIKILCSIGTAILICIIIILLAFLSMFFPEIWIFIAIIIIIVVIVYMFFEDIY